MAVQNTPAAEAEGQAPAEENKSASSEQQDETKEASDASEEVAEGAEEVDAEESDSDEEDSKEESKPKKKNGFKKRIDKLNRRNSELQSRLEYLERQITSKNPSEEQSKQAQKSDDSRPKASDFDTHDDFVEALTDWKIEKKTQQAKEQSELQTRTEKLVAKIGEFKKSHTDFDDVMESIEDLRLNKGLLKILGSAENPQLMYELAKNRKELERINSLSIEAAGREVGKFEAKLSTSESKNIEKKQTKAPPPINPVGGKASVKRSLSDPELSFKDYVAMRMESKKRK